MAKAVAIAASLADRGVGGLGMGVGMGVGVVVMMWLWVVCGSVCSVAPVRRAGKVGPGDEMFAQRGAWGPVAYHGVAGYSVQV